ncbi:hypothetical protein N656DRAFT_769803 [Canariomyces notabilis]|uniref:Uncharacterized protein n=1 Tax=Canariomyces notabilis TaxID=2074819 RepID=A0AAN6QRB4_9PEZI|nr:hypothetical protein N656DRAFT_769803 [Canariomyces arenarius]
MTRIGYNTKHSTRPRVKAEGTEAVGEVHKNEEVKQFVLLANILWRARLNNPEVTSCLKRYVNTLPPQALAILKSHLPHIEAMGDDFVPTAKNIAQLGPKRSLNVEAIAAALRSGWIRALLRRLAAQAAAAAAALKGEDVIATHGEDENGGCNVNANANASEEAPWFTNPDCAIWLGEMAHLRAAMPDDAWFPQVSRKMRDAYTAGWLGVFGLARPKPEKPEPQPRPKKANSRFEFDRKNPRFPERPAVAVMTIDKRLRSPKPAATPEPTTASGSDSTSESKTRASLGQLLREDDRDFSQRQRRYRLRYDTYSLPR